MTTRTSSAGLQLTELGLGTAQLGNLYRETSDLDAAATVDAAWDAGVRYFDTAPHYGLGLAERRLGSALAARPRDEYVLSSKVGRILEPNPGGADRQDDEGFAVPAITRRRWDFSRDGVLRSIEATLTRTGLDRLDIVYLHDPDDHFEQASTEGVGALIELREQGVITAVGAGMNQAAALADLIRVADVDLVMVAGRFTLLDQTAAIDLLPIALDRGVGVVAAGVYNSGLLGTARPATGATFDYETASDERVLQAGRIADICERYGVSLPEAAVAFPLQHPAVVSVVLGARTAEQAAVNSARAGARIPDDLWHELGAAGLIGRAAHAGAAGIGA